MLYLQRKCLLTPNESSMIFCENYDLPFPLKKSKVKYGLVIEPAKNIVPSIQQGILKRLMKFFLFDLDLDPSISSLDLFRI